MKLYELQQRPGKRPQLVNADTPPVCPYETRYFTNGQLAQQTFNQTRKALQKEGLNARLRLYQVGVRTDLRASDWCSLLEADAPGMNCEITPQDLVTHRSLITRWNSNGGEA